MIPTALLTWEQFTLHLRNPFRLSYGVSETRQAFCVRLAGDEGWGEGTIPPYYGVDPADMMACWERASRRTDPLPEEPEQVPGWIGTDGPAPARSALDLALYDRMARKRGVPLYELLGLPQPQPMATSFTIAIDTPQEMARLASEVPGYGIIKVKLGSEDDEARLAAIRQARPDVRLLVDANAGWTRDNARQLVKTLMQYNVELIEQPLRKDDIEGMGLVQAECPVPVVADESVQTYEQVERLAAAGVQGINVKLMKVGGLTPALRILRRCQELGLRVMLGSMIETSVGITAMAHLAGMADWLDLDAPLLVSNDPFEGVRIDANAVLCLPERPGIGVALKADAL
jgi:L-alanine-DL-glutamate epimerase-like enolase superfamily enzyme